MKSFRPVTDIWNHLRDLASYRVGSANFSWRKIWYANNNCADSKNVAGAREPNVHEHFLVNFESGQRKKSFSLIHEKIHLKRVNHKLIRRTIDATSTWRFSETSSSLDKGLVLQSSVEKKASFLDSRKNSRKKASFLDSRKVLLRGNPIKKPKRSRKRSAMPEAKEIHDRSTEADVYTLGRSIKLFFFFFFFFSTIV